MRTNKKTKEMRETDLKTRSDFVGKEEGAKDAVFFTETDVAFRIRSIKSFAAKLICSNDETKSYYNELKNEILSYKGIRSRISWNYESFNFGKDQIAKFSVRNGTLCLYFALDMKELKGSKYRVELCPSTRYAAVPCMYRIRNARRCECAKELIAMVTQKFGLVKGKTPGAECFSSYENSDALLKKVLIKKIKSKIARPAENGRALFKFVDVTLAERSMTDEDAVTYIKDDVDGKKHKGKRGVVHVDVLSEHFEDGDTVNVEALRTKNLIPSDVGRVKLLAKGSLDKTLNVHLQEYSLQAVKMIVLVGGTVHRAG